MEKLVSVAIVNWNGEKYLYKCIVPLQICFFNSRQQLFCLFFHFFDGCGESVCVNQKGRQKVVLFLLILCQAPPLFQESDVQARPL